MFTSKIAQKIFKQNVNITKSVGKNMFQNFSTLIYTCTSMAINVFIMNY